MSGGGHIIIQNAVKQGLNDPLVTGGMPADMKQAVQAALAKDPSTWTHRDNVTLGHAVTWALCNL